MRLNEEPMSKQYNARQRKKIRFCQALVPYPKKPKLSRGQTLNAESGQEKRQKSIICSSFLFFIIYQQAKNIRTEHIRLTFVTYYYTWLFFKLTIHIYFKNKGRRCFEFAETENNFNGIPVTLIKLQIF